jgi:6-phosphogluconate dehydrogenase
LDNEAIHQVFERWDEGRLQSFLIDITKDIFIFKAPGSDHLLVDDIKDEARSKGTGKWTSQVAMDLETPIPTIDTAVAMRDLSKYKQLREKASALYSIEEPKPDGNTDTLLLELEQAFFFSMIITYAQGMDLLLKASKDYHYQLRLDEIAKIWRGGCIIRSVFLTDIFNAYQKDPLLENLLLDEQVKTLLIKALPGARSIVSKSAAAGIAMPAYASSLTYFDAFRSKRMPSNLIQAQRDYFGAHTYELIGKEGIFHTQWLAENTEDLIHNT